VVGCVTALGFGDVGGDAAKELLGRLDDVAIGVFAEVAAFEDDAGVVGEGDG
jgi:hypothetical protein